MQAGAARCRCRFLPATCKEYQAIWLDDDGEALAGGSASKAGGKKYVDFAWWLLAWDRYALAAVATKQMDFKQAMQHKAVVAEVAANAATEGKSSLVAVIYDDLVRYVRLGFSVA